MSAGRGVTHSEFNNAPKETTHFLQIWLLPHSTGIAPGYEQKHFDAAAKRGRLTLVASSDARDGSVRIHADADVHAGLFDGAEAASHRLAPGRCAYVHVARGDVSVNGQRLAPAPWLSCTMGSSRSIAASPAASRWPFTLTSPRATCT